MKTVIVTPPITEPVSLSEAKAQLRIEDAFTLDDDYISALISAARDRCESYCNQFFTQQSLEIIFETKAEGTVDLPYPGLIVNNIIYVNQDNIPTIIDPSDYVYSSIGQKLEFLNSFDSKGWLMQVNTTAPASIYGVQMAIKMIVTDLYELRTETAVGVSLSDNPAVKALLYPYRLSLGV